MEVLSAYIEKHTVNTAADIFIVNPTINNHAVDDFLEKVSIGGYKLIGLSVPQGTYFIAKSILEKIAQLKQNHLVVLGHAIPTYTPEIFLDDFPDVVVVHGWGEEALVQLVNYVNAGSPRLDDIANISFFDKANEKIISTSINYSADPVPAKRVSVSKYFARIETSRDCHYGLCTFCTRPPGLSKSWKRLPVEEILQSVQELKNAGVTYFTFADEDFVGNDLNGALEIATGIEKIGGMSFSISLRADNVFNPNSALDSQENLLRNFVISQLKKSGLSFMFIGLESLSDSQLKRYGKGVKPKDAIEAINIIKQHEIPLEVGFMLFDPFISLKELEEITLALRNSGVWENVGKLFLELRVQSATSFEIWLRQKNLLGKFDPNLLSYQWAYQDPDVGEIAKNCMQWAEQFDNCYRLLLNLVRTDITNLTAKYFMKVFKKLDLLMLESVLSWYDKNSKVKDLKTLNNEFGINRYVLAGALESELIKKFSDDRAEIAKLIRELNVYRSMVRKNLGKFAVPSESDVINYTVNN